MAPLGLSREIVIVRGDGLDVVVLALGFSSDHPAEIDRLPRTLSLGRRRASINLFPTRWGRDAPGCGGPRIAVECFAESLVALGKPEGMEQRHAPLKAA